MNTITGSCLCGEVTFNCQDKFDHFQLCHCTQCQKSSGSAHASNYFTTAENINWLSGKQTIKRYNVPGRAISSAFCQTCGSPVPYVSKSGKALIVPAGCLDSLPSQQLERHIFWCEKAAWYEQVSQVDKVEKF